MTTTRQVRAVDLREGGLFLIEGRRYRLVTKSVHETTGALSLFFASEAPQDGQGSTTKRFNEQRPDELFEEIVEEA